MAQCNFSIPFSTSAEALAEKARYAISNAGGNFLGDSNSGNFDVSTPLGTIRGNYLIQGDTIHVSITSKPFLVSCGLIEKQLQGYFSQVA
jgi:hypothetical protein